MGGFNEGGGDSSRDKKDANDGGGISDKVNRDNERDSVSARGNRGTSNSNSENGNNNSENGNQRGEGGNEGGEAGNEGGEPGNEGGGETPPRDCDPIGDEVIPRPPKRDNDRRRDNDYVWPLPEFQPPTVRISASGGYGTEVRPSGPSSVAEPIVGVSGGASVLPVLEIGP